MEGRDGQATGGTFRQLGVYPLAHFSRRFIGKGHRGDMSCRQLALLNQVSDFIDNDPGFTATSACQYQTGAANKFNRCVLLWI